MSPTPSNTVKVVTDPAAGTSWRQFFFFSGVISITAIATWLMADILWRGGMSGVEMVSLILFVPLFGMVAFGFLQAVVGFCILLASRSEDKREITVTLPPEDRSQKLPPTALLIPIYNEDVPRVYEGLRAMFIALAKAGLGDCFDFFILSDSSDPNKWIEEEVGWIDLCKELNGFGKIFYRKRHIALNRKSGNISDFCRRWGKRYRYMVVLDADSLMTPETLRRMVRLMEANPRTGILQTAPQPIESKTPFARLLQFSGHCYGPIFQAGLNFWQSYNGNFWGHNAIIRTAPFIEHCSLPNLPGSGYARFMSHDYVEAALMRRANYQVWLTYSLGGSYENLPPTMIDGAKRDRRWCRGNFQHSWLLFAKGFKPLNRLHITIGILSYLCSPLWLTFLAIGILQYSRDIAATVHSFDADVGISSYLDIGGGKLALILFLVTMFMLTLPKFLALVLVLRDRAQRQAFGGGTLVTLSVILEHTASILMAPIQMLFTTLSVICVLSGREIGWGAQRRDAGGIDWAGILRAHTWHTLVGIGFAAFAWHIQPTFFFWMLPVTIGLVFSIPISALLANETFGDFLNRVGIFRTPPETNPPGLVAQMENRLAAGRRRLPPPEWLRSHFGIAEVVLDPYINAAHVSLLRVKRRLNHKTGDYLNTLRDRLLSNGPAALTNREMMALLRSPEEVTRLHDLAWRLPDSELPAWWAGAMRFYNLQTGTESAARLYRG